jgi:hypothetical protein
VTLGRVSGVSDVLTERSIAARDTVRGRLVYLVLQFVYALPYDEFLEAMCIIHGSVRGI